MDIEHPKISEKIENKNENNDTLLRIRKDLKFNLNPSRDFLEFKRNNSIFLDKSLLIKDVLERKAGNSVYFLKSFIY